jgi:hypothetical protein
MEGRIYVKQAGHCTRCAEPFGGNRTTAYMVDETVAAEIFGVEWDDHGLHADAPVGPG